MKISFCNVFTFRVGRSVTAVQLLLFKDVPSTCCKTKGDDGTVQEIITFPFVGTTEIAGSGVEVPR
ncbi:MAG: hypothetical protein JWM68_1162 [Verrucomicrobiales bacterium]|nr:hypothetical protein [Verrucomicrobiales bacterium]